MNKNLFRFIQRNTWLCGFGLLLFTGWAGKPPVFKNGIYRAVLQRPDGQEIAFNFQTKDSAGKKVLYVLNAAEKLLVDSITVKEDSVFIQMPFFDSQFKAVINDSGNLQGSWIKKYGDRDQVLPFVAVYNQKQRFVARQKPRHVIEGRWDATFTSAKGDVSKAIGEFQQKGTLLTGTFLTPSGDYRYLQGIVSGDSLLLSGFDGGHAFLFTAKIESSNKISGGQFYSGLNGLETWTAKKDAAIELPDGYDQTRLREGETSLNFRFNSTEGDTVSIKDDRFKNKVVLVQILGSWCPNCMDETAFLSDYYNHNHQKGFEVVGLAYERTTDFEKSRIALQRFLKRFNVQYPILITGATVSDALQADKTLPQLTGIKAFPTSIFIDKKGVVRKIYTGFNGPGTGEHYQAFQKEFDETVRQLLEE